MKQWLLTFVLAVSFSAFSTERIVTIGGDVSEIVFALGAGEKVVARDSTSQKPTELLALPDVGYMRMLNPEGILSMNPTLVLTSELAKPSLALKQLQDSGVEVIQITGKAALEAVPEKIKAVAKAVNQTERGAQLIQQYQKALTEIPTTTLPTRILFVMSHGGIMPMAAGQKTAADKMIRAVGATNAMQGFNNYRPLSQEGVIASAPDLLLVTEDGIKSMGGLDKIWQLPGLKHTPAGQKKRVLIVDDMGLLGFGLETPLSDETTQTGGGEDSMSRMKSPGLGLAFLCLLLSGLAIGSANIGALSLSFKTLWESSISEPQWQIWLNIRLPRVLLAILVGCALATSGAVMQGLFRNPLADPGLLGISSGAALMVAMAIVLPVSLPSVIAVYGHIIAAFIGSLLISLLIFSLNKYNYGNLARLLLAGIAINALCMSAIGVLSYISDDQQLRQFSLWMMGSLSQIEWPTLAITASLIIPAIILTFSQARKLNLLQLGDEEAHYLGINVQRTKFQLLLLSALLIGSAVALSGVIGFVGLVIPHLIRMRFGGDHNWLLPGAALGGASLLLTADTLARTLVSPAEIPVGLITGLIGGPYFLWLILKQPGPGSRT